MRRQRVSAHGCLAPDVRRLIQSLGLCIALNLDTKLLPVHNPFSLFLSTVRPFSLDSTIPPPNQSSHSWSSRSHSPANYSLVSLLPLSVIQIDTFPHGRSRRDGAGWVNFSLTQPKLSLTTSRSQKQDDREARFYDNYRRVAEEYDKDLLKKYGGDLDTTLIFVGSAQSFDEHVLIEQQAGLFSAVTSAFIIEVDSQLQPDPGDETAALLRVLIYKIDNTTFGNDIPTLPQWNGPPPAMVHVQAILFASLAVSLLAALLAMLGKQWLSRYDSSDMRGSSIERSHNRQRKFDGIDTWYFTHVMELLPLMLQAALLLLGCALSRYLWEVSIIVASVVLGVTSFGLLFYIFIIVAGVASESCPYQTPGSLALRYLAGPINLVTRSIGNLLFGLIYTVAVVCSMGFCNPQYCRDYIIDMGKLVFGFTLDVLHLGWAVVQGFTMLVVHGTHRTDTTLEQKETVSGLRCISWTLQTSLDNGVHLSAFQQLAMRTEFISFNPTLVAGLSFDFLISCTNLSGGKMATMRGKEQLATVAATCLLHSLNHLSVMDPAPSVLTDICQRYNRVFPLYPDFISLPFYHTMATIHSLTKQPWSHQYIQWDNFRPSSQEYNTFAQQIVEVARVKYRQTEYQKVSRWILRFALHSLALDPLPPVPVIVNCLTIVAIDLGCRVSDITALEERYVQIV